ncbi:hypothetical protein HQ585_18970, partial [candidate division KSB1 bacterium]|nr:hypothetical protein [candidate division KSB1 bacterium]
DTETGKPIENVKIKYKQNTSEKYPHGKFTDKEGCFTLQIPVGRVYIILAEAEGYQSKEMEIINDGSDKQNFEMELEKEIIKVERSFTLKYKLSGDVSKRLFQEMGGEVGLQVRSRDYITVIGTESKLADAEKIILDYDQPPKQIMIQVMLLVASRGDRKEVEHHPKLKKIVKKLTSLFSYNYYWVIGEAEMIGTEGEPFTVMSEGQQSAFSMDTRLKLQDDVIKLEGMKITVEKPTRAEIKTTVNIKNGETVILGASSGQHEGEAMITVVTAQIM